MLLDLPEYADLIRLEEPVRRPEPTEPGEVVAELIQVLRAEAPHAASELARQGVGGRRLLRALLTLRPPAALPAGCEEQLDRLLAHERSKTRIVDVMTLPHLGTTGPGELLRSCALYQGDITRLRVDAIVNAANSALLGCFSPFHGCIDNAIHDKAGPRLRADCELIMRAQNAPEPVGAAKVTRAYHLPSRYVLHTVGPTVRGPLHQEHLRQLASSYESCLDLATRVGARSIALCGISTGVFGFPKLPAASIAVATVVDFLRRRPQAFDVVVFNVFDDTDHSAYQAALQEVETR